jgi:hypothetical protein
VAPTQGGLDLLNNVLELSRKYLVQTRELRGAARPTIGPSSGFAIVVRPGGLAEEQKVPDEDNRNEQTPESHLLDQHPGVRELVESLPGFVVWSSDLPMVEVDGEIFHVLRGDELAERDRVIVEWVRLYQPDLFGEEA